MTTTFGYFDLGETFPQPGCAVCNLLLRDADRLLDSILYEYVTDPEIQADFRASRGLCNEHGWQFLRADSALGVAILYQGALAELIRVTESSTPDASSAHGLLSAVFPQSPASAIADALEPTTVCIACKMQKASEECYISTLGEQIVDERLQSAYRSSEGLCLRHFQQVLRHAQAPERAKLLVSIQTERWSHLHMQLEEFIRKNNFHHADEKMGEEDISWQRVVLRLGGHGTFGIHRR
jgi:hypothetical protein